jgi:hypothetical protein
MNDEHASPEDMRHPMRDRVRMLDLVIEYAKETDQVDEVDQIDDVDNLKPFVHGVLQMRWMHLTDAPAVGTHRVGSGAATYKRRMMHLLEEPGIVFWAGYYPRRKTKRAHTVVGLGGSIKHVIGAREVDGRTSCERRSTGSTQRPLSTVSRGPSSSPVGRAEDTWRHSRWIIARWRPGCRFRECLSWLRCGIPLMSTTRST